MSTEDEFELNYIKIDSKNEIKLLGAEDYAAEMSTFFSTVMEFEQEKITKKILKDLEKDLPENSELLKYNIDFSKKFIKIINVDKKKYYNSSVNRLLSIDFKDKFIFSYSNIFDVCSILTMFFNELKKYKISSIDDIKKKIKKINFQKYLFGRLYLKLPTTINKKKDANSSLLMNQSKSTDISSIKDINDSTFELEEHNFNNKMYETFLEKNIKSNFILNGKCIYTREEEPQKPLTKENFIYPEYNKIGGKDLKLNKTELPIELIMLLSKLKEVKCLVFQIQNVEDNFKKLASFILSNLDWLFLKGIEEVQLDLGNEDIQKGLDKAFEIRTEDLYAKCEKNKEKIYYNGSYRARAINCWIPEGDIFFEENDTRRREFNYSSQMTEDCVMIDNYISKIYNAFGNLTSIKYVIPVNYGLRNDLNNLFFTRQQHESRSLAKCFDDIEDFNSTIDNFNESISLFDFDSQEKYMLEQRNSLNPNNNKISISQLNDDNSQNNDFNNKSSTPSMIRNFTSKYKTYFKMLLIYSYFFSKTLKNIQKLSVYFHTSYSYEIYLCYKTNLNFDLSHFLIFMNKIESLKEVNFSFNSLDDKSFEYILGILYRNTSLTQLRMSFFSPDVNYYDNALFNLCSAKKISLTKLFNEYNENQIKYGENKQKKINEFILEEKFLNSLAINFSNLTNLLKLQLLKNLEELIFRFDIPLPLFNNQKYILLIIKFLINILIMLTFQQNKTHTFKILAPNLEFNSNKMPFINSFFNEISLDDEIDKITDNMENKKEKEKIKHKDKKEQLEKENLKNEQEKELKEKNERGEILQKIGETDSDLFSEIPQEKTDEYDININKNLENYDSSKKYKSMFQKSTTEKAALRNKGIRLSDSEPNVKSRKLNPNESLEHLVIQLKIYNIPEIFNICKINNISGLKSINLGNFDDITFKGFVKDYKLNCDKLISLVSLKINLGISVLSYNDLREDILDFINIKTPNLKEIFLLSNLIIDDEEKMKELIELVYYKANIEKIIIKINNKNIELFSKLLSKFIIDYKNIHKNYLYSIIYLAHHPKFKQINSTELFKVLSKFIVLNDNRCILCDEYKDNYN